MAKNISSEGQMMFKYLVKLIIAAIFMTHFSCKQNKSCDEVVLADERITTLVKDYVNKNPRFNTFIIKLSPKQTVGDIVIESGFLVGPGYESILMDHNHSLYCNIQGKRIYFISEINRLLKANLKDTWKNSNAADSIVKISDYENRIIKDAFTLFMHRAIFFRFDESNNLIINFQPDTVFLPKCLKSSVRFENITDKSAN